MEQTPNRNSVGGRPHTPNDIHTPDPLIWAGENNVNLLDPQLHDLHLKDINRALSREGRYSNLSELPWTVGQHILLCCGLACLDGYRFTSTVESRTGMNFLKALYLHDASEAYLKDINRPMKTMDSMSGYRDMEASFSSAIHRRFGVHVDKYVKASIKYYDNLALSCEVHVVMPSVLSHWRNLPEPSDEGIEYVERIAMQHAYSVDVECALNKLADVMDLRPVAGDDLTKGEW